MGAGWAEHIPHWHRPNDGSEAVGDSSSPGASRADRPGRAGAGCVRTVCPTTGPSRICWAGFSWQDTNRSPIAVCGLQWPGWSTSWDLSPHWGRLSQPRLATACLSEGTTFVRRLSSPSPAMLSSCRNLGKKISTATGYLHKAQRRATVLAFYLHASLIHKIRDSAVMHIR